MRENGKIKCEWIFTEKKAENVDKNDWKSDQNEKVSITKTSGQWNALKRLHGSDCIEDSDGRRTIIFLQNHRSILVHLHCRFSLLDLPGKLFSLIFYFFAQTPRTTIVSSLESNRVSVTQKVWTLTGVLVSRVRQFRGKEIGKIWCAYAVHSWFRLQTDNRLGTTEWMVWNGREKFSSLMFRWVRVIWSDFWELFVCFDRFYLNLWGSSVN